MGAKIQALDIFQTPLSSHYPLPLSIKKVEAIVDNHFCHKCRGWIRKNYSGSGIDQAKSSESYRILIEKLCLLVLNRLSHELALTAINLVHFLHDKIMGAPKKFKNQPRLLLRPSSINFCQNFSNLFHETFPLNVITYIDISLSRAKEGNLRLGGVVIVSLKSLEDVDMLALAHFMVGSCLVLEVIDSQWSK